MSDRVRELIEKRDKSLPGRIDWVQSEVDSLWERLDEKLHELDLLNKEQSEIRQFLGDVYVPEAHVDQWEFLDDDIPEDVQMLEDKDGDHWVRGLHYQWVCVNPNKSASSPWNGYFTRVP